MAKQTDRQQFLDQIHELISRYIKFTNIDDKFIPGETAIPPSGKVVGEEEIQLMVEAVLDGWLTIGRFNEMFESALEEFIGVKHAVTTNSGSSANLLAFSALTSPCLGERAIKAGDEVITVAAAFPTTVNPILQWGAVPVFVDVDLPHYNVVAQEVEKAITSKTKAIMIAHALGNPFDLVEICRIAQKYGLWLIEDCCDALGSQYNGKQVGTFGDLATFSFYPAHQITMGEGGAVVTSDNELKRIVLSFRDWGRDCSCAPGSENTCKQRYDHSFGMLPLGYDHKYVYSHLGYNLKITDIQAACGYAQLRRLPEFIEKRKEHFNYLRQQLAELEDVLILPVATDSSDPSWFGFPLTIRETSSIARRPLIQYLDSQKIGSRLLFGGNLIRQPYMINQKFRVSGSLMTTDLIMANTFWIGLYPGLSYEKLAFVCEKIKRFFHNSSGIKGEVF